MRHGKAFRKLNRSAASRKHLFSMQVTSLIEHDRIETTVAKAKELRKIADKVVTMAKYGDQHSRLRASKYVKTPEGLVKLFTEMAERYSDRKGGYCRILRCGVDPRGKFPKAIVEYVDTPFDLKESLLRYKLPESKGVTIDHLTTMIRNFKELMHKEVSESKLTKETQKI